MRMIDALKALYTAVGGDDEAVLSAKKSSDVVAAIAEIVKESNE